MYNVHADRGTEGSRVFKNNGLLYKILDVKGNPIGVPIKASSFYSKPTLKFLEEKFKANEIKKQSHKSHLKNTIKLVLLDKQLSSPEKLAAKLQNEGVHIVLRKSKEGQLYGITYIDHKTQSVFNGSSLGKEFSAKGILESCALNFPHQISILVVSETTQNLDSENHLKFNAIEVLLQVENTNDYVPKDLKQKKKNRIRRRI